MVFYVVLRWRRMLINVGLTYSRNSRVVIIFWFLYFSNQQIHKEDSIHCKMLENLNFYFINHDGLLLYPYAYRFISKHFLLKSIIFLEKLLNIWFNVVTKSCLSINIFALRVWRSKTQNN